jgi:hypothetical protein
MKAPKPKFQIPKKLQTPTSEKAVYAVLRFGVWTFFGAWDLGFGI